MLRSLFDLITSVFAHAVCNVFANEKRTCQLIIMQGIVSLAKFNALTLNNTYAEFKSLGYKGVADLNDPFFLEVRTYSDSHFDWLVAR